MSVSCDPANTPRPPRRLIASLGVLADIFSSYHSGLSLSVSCPGRPGWAPADVPADMTFQYYALDFPYGAVFPVQLVDGAFSATSTSLLTPPLAVRSTIPPCDVLRAV